MAQRTIESPSGKVLSNTPSTDKITSDLNPWCTTFLMTRPAPSAVHMKLRPHEQNLSGRARIEPNHQTALGTGATRRPRPRQTGSSQNLMWHISSIRPPNHTTVISRMAVHANPTNGPRDRPTCQVAPMHAPLPSPHTVRDRAASPQTQLVLRLRRHPDRGQ